MKPTHPFTQAAIIGAFLHTGADWKRAVENLRHMGGEEYEEAADILERHGEFHEANRTETA